VRADVANGVAPRGRPPAGTPGDEARSLVEFQGTWTPRTNSPQAREILADSKVPGRRERIHLKLTTFSPIHAVPKFDQ